MKKDTIIFLDLHIRLLKNLKNSLKASKPTSLEPKVKYLWKKKELIIPKICEQVIASK